MSINIINANETIVLKSQSVFQNVQVLLKNTATKTSILKVLCQTVANSSDDFNKSQRTKTIEEMAVKIILNCKIEG